MKSWLLEEESGQGMVEYALILALISIAAIAIMKNLSTAVQNKFTDVETELNNTNP